MIFVVCLFEWIFVEEIVVGMNGDDFKKMRCFDILEYMYILY